MAIEISVAMMNKKILTHNDFAYHSHSLGNTFFFIWTLPCIKESFQFSKSFAKLHLGVTINFS